MGEVFLEGESKRGFLASLWSLVTILSAISFLTAFVYALSASEEENNYNYNNNEESHDEKEAEIAMAVSPELLGINNRDLKTFDVDINNSIKIKKMLPKSQLIISESGIYSRDDINDLNEAKIYNFLVGEFFMRKKEPYKAVQDLIALSPISSR